MLTVNSTMNYDFNQTFYHVFPSPEGQEEKQKQWQRQTYTQSKKDVLRSCLIQFMRAIAFKMLFVIDKG